jgi:hypothetical protein
VKIEQKVNTNKKVDCFAVYSHASGPSIPLRGLSMGRINVFSFYKLGASVAPLRLIGRPESNLAHEVLFAAQRNLGNYLKKTPLQCKH